MEWEEVPLLWELHYGWIIIPKRVDDLNGLLFHIYQCVLYLLRCPVSNSSHTWDLETNLKVSGSVTLQYIGLWWDFSLEIPPHSEKHHEDVIAMWEFLIKWEDVLRDQLHCVGNTAGLGVLLEQALLCLPENVGS